MAMAVENFTIDLGARDQVYTLGDSVSGEIRFTLNKEIRVREIYLHFSGRGKVEVMEGRTTFVGKQEYYRHVAKLLDEDQIAAQQGLLKPGDYSYPFSFDLPFDDDLPGTFEAKHGYIKYCLDALIDRPLRMPDKTSTLITVIDYVEIDDTLLVPQQKQERWRVGYNCCASGYLSVMATLDRTGFYAGDEAKVSVFVDNQSSRDVTEVEICLYQFTTYIYGTEENEYQVKDRLIDSVKQGGVVRGKEANFHDVIISIPRLRPTSMCGIVTSSYTIEIVINIKGRWVEAAHIPFPVIIGSIRTTGTNRLAPITEVPGEESSLAIEEKTLESSSTQDKTENNDHKIDDNAMQPQKGVDENPTVSIESHEMEEVWVTREGSKANRKSTESPKDSDNSKIEEIKLKEIKVTEELKTIVEPEATS